MAQSARTVIVLFMFFPALSTRHSSLALVSLDHLIRPIQHGLWYRKPDLLGGFEVYPQLNLFRLFQRQIGGFGPPQVPAHVRGDAPVAVRNISPVVHEPAGIYKFSVGMRRR